MSAADNTIHIHIGVDNVMEEVLGRALSPEIASANNHDFTFIHDKFYKKYFRDSIDNGVLLDTSKVLSYISQMPGVLVLSRPKFLYTGTPINFGDKENLSLYKLVCIQRAFAEFRVVFHLFLTDHLTYLFYHRQKDIGLDQVKRCSWLPLVSGIRSNLHQNGELRIWDAENKSLFQQRLLTDFLGLPVSTALDLYARYLQGPNGRLSSKFVEETALKMGWDVEALDIVYENDLQAIYSS
jgi:hypothetical protein